MLRKLVGVGVGLIVFAAACSEDSPTGSSDELLGKEEFVSRAEEICSDAQDEVYSLQAVLNEQTNDVDPAPGPGVKFFDDATNVGRAALEELRGLHGPTEDQPVIEELLEGVQSAIDEAGRSGDALAAGTPLPVFYQAQPPRSTQDIGVDLDRYQRLTNYGFRSCPGLGLFPTSGR